MIKRRYLDGYARLIPKIMKKHLNYNIITLILCVLILCTTVAIVVVLLSDRNTDTVMTTTSDKIIQLTTPNTTPGATSSVTPTTTTVKTPDTTTVDPVTQPIVTTPAQVTTTEPPVTTIPKTPTDEYKYDFVADLSEYEQYMNPTGDLWDDAYLLLVNPERPLTKDEELSYEFLKNTVKFDSDGIIKKYPTSQKTNAVALKALEAMAMEIAASGVRGKGSALAVLGVQSAYRDYATQEIIFERNVSNTKKYVCDSCGHVFIGKASYTKCEVCNGSVSRVDITREEAVENVKTYSCQQGTSEHQSTLAFDLIDTTYPSSYVLEQIFAETDLAKWLEENCYKFGFILRFPEDKEDITGIIYEPWHFRYVGRYHATKMHELDMCLEEYIEYLEENEYFDKGE